MKKLTEEIANALERTADTLGLSELSLRTGLKISTIQRFINRRSKYIRQESLDKLYPFLRPHILLKSADTVSEKPLRIGDAPRAGHWLDDLVSDEKILIDVFSALSDIDKSTILKSWHEESPGPVATNIVELNDAENLMLAIYRALSPESQQEHLMPIVRKATSEMRRRRESI